MANPTLEARFREIVKGGRRGVAAAAVRGLLGCLEVPYKTAVSLRNRRFDQRPAACQRVGVPVVSVGNLTLGGTGKTPMVKWIARQIEQQGLRVVLISRGYRGDGNENDEARELAQELPGVPHLQNPDRVAAAEQAIAEFGAEVLLLDDAFQHRRIARDLDIVLLDATEPFGCGRVFPRGLLREPAIGLQRADVVCLTRANLVNTDRREAIRREASRLAPNAVWCVAEHAPSSLLNHAGGRGPLSALEGQRVAAFCGIGNPEAFKATLESIGCEIALWRPMPDHHHFTPGDWSELTDAAATTGAHRLVCTHKDLVKIEPAWVDDLPLDAVLVEMRLSRGEEELNDRLESLFEEG